MSAVIFNDQRDDLLKEVRLADELKRARESFLWRWLLAIAQSEATEAQKLLVLVNPLDQKEIIRLQLIAQRCMGLEAWMDVAIQKGEHAEQHFDARQAEAGGLPASE